MGLPGFELGSLTPKELFSEKSSQKSILSDFRDVLDVYLGLKEKTIDRHMINARHFLENVEINEISKGKIRKYLKDRKKKDSLNTYANRLKTLRRFFRDYLGASELIESFKFPHIPRKNHTVPSKEKLRQFYNEILTSKYRAMFLIFATSGLRTSEVLNLEMDNLNLEKRMIIPNHDSRTKQSYVSFYNEEAERELKRYLPERSENDETVFQVLKSNALKSFRKTSDRSGIKITPKDLRKWFSSEMGKLGVGDRYVDAFCGRVPQSVLGKHYTDFSPERLKEVYEKADLKILS